MQFCSWLALKFLPSGYLADLVFDLFRLSKTFNSLTDQPHLKDKNDRASTCVIRNNISCLLLKARAVLHRSAAPNARAALRAPSRTLCVRTCYSALLLWSGVTSVVELDFLSCYTTAALLDNMWVISNVKFIFNLGCLLFRLCFQLCCKCRFVNKVKS